MHRNSTRRRSSSNPGRFLQDPDRNSLRPDSRRPQNIKSKDINSCNRDSLIAKPRMRSFSSDRLSGMKKSNLPLRSTTAEKSAGTSSMELGYKGRLSNLDQLNVVSKGYITPMTTKSRNVVPTSEGRSVRASSAERASALAPKGPKKDTRPLNDKNYLNEMSSKIDNYFHSINQSTILNSNGSIKPLTIKIFVEATNLLIKLLDMKSLLTTNNYIEEIPKVAKNIHYPGLMNKSWLKTANTMHSWPHAIGWISWLVELCEAKDVASETFTLEKLPMVGISEEEKENYRIKFLTMIQCYKAWNEEKPEDEERIIQEFFEEEAKKRGINTTKYDKLQTELDEAEKTLRREESKNNKLDKEIIELQQFISSLKKDRVKQQEHLAEQEKYIETTLNNIEQLGKDCIVYSNDIKKLEMVKEELSGVIKQQPMSITERDEIIKICSEQETFIQNFDGHLEELKKESYSLDLRLVSSNTTLVKTILAYNQMLFMLSSDFNINIDELLMPEKGLCESNFMNKLEDKKNLMSTFIQKGTEELNKKLNLLQSCQKDKDAMQIKKDILSNKLEKKKASEEKLKQDLNYKQNKILEEIKKMKNNIAEISNLIVERSRILESTNQQLADVADKKDALIRRNVRLQESATDFFRNMYNILDDYRFKIRKTLTQGYLENNFE